MGVAHTRSALGQTHLGAGLRRAWEIELGSSALVLAAQQVMCTIPLLMVLAGIRPAGGSDNFGYPPSGYLGLPVKARAESKSRSTPLDQSPM
jgi:hypothetical protein